MLIDFWDVGSAHNSRRAMTTADVSAHLAADWLPSLPTSVSSALIGWPPFVLEGVHHNGQDLLCLRDSVGRSERQWKGVLSWMLGVAGTRHFLSLDGYQWIAPLSAFYPEAKQTVDTSWHPAYPPGRLLATRPTGSNARLRPDFVAVKPGSSSLEWAVVESKGTRSSLANQPNCRTDWRQQVRNVELRIDGVCVEIQRHLVVATRVNPSAKRPVARRIQVRAWNSNATAEGPNTPIEAIAEVATAHLFGLFLNLGMPANAKALALARWRQIDGSSPDADPQRTDIARLQEAAGEELKDRAGTTLSSSGESKGPTVVSLRWGAGISEVTLAAPLLNLVRGLQSANEPAQLDSAISAADEQLAKWRTETPSVDDRETTSISLPFGITVRLPFSTLAEAEKTRGTE